MSFQLSIISNKLGVLLFYFFYFFFVGNRIFVKELSFMQGMKFVFWNTISEQFVVKMYYSNWFH